MLYSGFFKQCFYAIVLSLAFFNTNRSPQSNTHTTNLNKKIIGSRQKGWWEVNFSDLLLHSLKHFYITASGGLFLLFTSHFTVIINSLCAIDTTPRGLNTFYLSQNAPQLEYFQVLYCNRKMRLNYIYHVLYNVKLSNEFGLPGEQTKVFIRSSSTIYCHQAPVNVGLGLIDVSSRLCNLNNG